MSTKSRCDPSRIPSSFSAGSVVASSEPWIWAFRWTGYQTVCAYCFTEGKELRRCSGCQLHRYCSITCQSSDWKKEHREECSMLKRTGAPHVKHDCNENGCDGVHEQSNYTVGILLLKLAKKIKQNEMYQLPGMGKKSPQELLSMFPAYPHPERLDSALQRDPVRGWMGEWNVILSGTELAAPSFADCFKIIAHNACHLWELGVKPAGDKTPFGSGLFPLIPYRHLTPVCLDCNVSLQFNGRHLLLLAVEDIPSFTGLCDLRYTDPVQDLCLASREERLHIFKSQKMLGVPYECPCRKCTSQYDAEVNPMKCITAGCTERIPSDDRAAEPCCQCGAINTNRLDQFRWFMDKYKEIRTQYRLDTTGLDLTNCSVQPVPQNIRRLGKAFVDCEAELDQRKFDLLKEMDAEGIVQADAHIRLVLGWRFASRRTHDGNFAEGWKIFEDLIPALRAIYPKMYVPYAKRLLEAGAVPIAGVSRSMHNDTSARDSDAFFALLEALPMSLGLLKEARGIFARLCGKESKLTTTTDALILTAQNVGKVVGLD